VCQGLLNNDRQEDRPTQPILLYNVLLAISYMFRPKRTIHFITMIYVVGHLSSRTLLSDHVQLCLTMFLLISINQ